MQDFLLGFRAGKGGNIFPIPPTPTLASRACARRDESDRASVILGKATKPEVSLGNTEKGMSICDSVEPVVTVSDSFRCNTVWRNGSRAGSPDLGRASPKLRIRIIPRNRQSEFWRWTSGSSPHPHIPSFFGHTKEAFLLRGHLVSDSFSLHRQVSKREARWIWTFLNAFQACLTQCTPRPLPSAKPAGGADISRLGGMPHLPGPRTY